MKKKQFLVLTIFASIALFGLMSADHIDAPLVAGGQTDITDLYVFQSPNNNDNMVFVGNVQGLMDPASTENAAFDPSMMLEFNIDNNGDNVEDLVIQCLYENNQLWVYGPTAPTMTGTNSRVNVAAMNMSGGITRYGDAPNIIESNGIKAFAGPRDDPFFFDFTRYTEILGGTQTGFANPGNDTFAGTNVLSTVVEVPKELLGGSGTLNVWLESKRK